MIRFLQRLFGRKRVAMSDRYFVAGGPSADPRDQDRGPELGGGPWDRNDPDRPSTRQRPPRVEVERSAKPAACKKSSAKPKSRKKAAPKAGARKRAPKKKASKH